MNFHYFRKILSDFIFIPLVVFCILNIPLVVYGIQMGKGQLSIVWQARSVKDVLLDPTIADSVKIKLKVIQEIRQFAFEKIGLTPTDNYTTFYDQNGKQIIYVVTACAPFALKPNLWHFPVLGAVPYKGFFNLEKAKKEERKMNLLGLDTDLGGASGWSTLGFFKDPVLSQMLSRNEGDLVELIIHELTHGTIFVKDNVDFNENLASFIGNKGAILFLKQKYGTESKELINYLAHKEDELKIEKYMLSCAHRLDSLYQQMLPELNLNLKNNYKKQMFNSFIENAKALILTRDSLLPSRLQKRINNAGNAFIMHYVRYGSKQHDFEEEFKKFNGDLLKYVELMKAKHLKN